MAIKRTVATSLLLTFFVPTIIVGWIFLSATLESFQQIELKIMHERVENLRKDFNRNLDQLAITARDWANWDDSVEFLKNPKEPSMLSWLLDYGTYDNAGISRLAYITLDYRIVFATRLDPEKKIIAEIPNDEALKLEELLTPLLKSAAPETEHLGVMFIDSEPNIIVAVPVLPTNADGNARGFFVFTRKMTVEYWTKLAADRSLRISTFPVSETEKVEQVVVQKGSLTGNLLLPDTKGKPIYWVSLTAPRDLYGYAVANRFEYLIALLIFAVLSVYFSFYLMNKYVISRLKYLEEAAGRIAENKDFAARLTEEGGVEFASLSKSLNVMLSGLQSAHKEIELARDHAEAANRAKISFISKVSHELRTPISTVIGNLGLLKKLRMPKESRHYLEVIEDSSEGLLGVVNDILDFTELSNTRVPISRRPTKIVDVLSYIIESKVPFWLKGKEIQFSIEIAKNIPKEIYSDKERLKQIVGHLVSNAIKFTSKGSVRLTITRENSTLVATVTDTGVGMDQELLTEMVEPFTQLEETSNRKHNGLGLGLTLVRRIVAAMEGTIKINSTRGVGTQIQILLPNSVLSESDTPSSALNTLYSNDGKNKDEAEFKLHVLVADDAPINRILIKNMLEEAGHSVVCVEDGKKMLDLVRSKENKFDLILADLEMPGYGGLEATELTRKNGVAVPIIILTQSKAHENHEELNRVGGNGFLTKPVKAKDLESVVQTAKTLRMN